MPALGWPEVLALLTSVGYGTLSAVFPPANAEAYVIASQMSSVAGAVPVAIGVAVGQTIGKLLLFLGVRRGRAFRFARHRTSTEPVLPVGPTRTRIRGWIAALLGLIGQKRWGLPIVALAAVIGFPPLYAVALLAGATKMRTLWFGIVVFVGRITRFTLIAVGIHGLSFW